MSSVQPSRDILLFFMMVGSNYCFVNRKNAILSLSIFALSFFIWHISKNSVPTSQMSQRRRPASGTMRELFGQIRLYWSSDPAQPRLPATIFTSYSSGSGIVTSRQPLAGRRSTIVHKVAIFSSSAKVWISNGSEDDAEEAWVAVGEERPHLIQCNRSSLLELSVTSSWDDFHGKSAVVFNNVEGGLLSGAVPYLREMSAGERNHAGPVWIYQSLESASYMRWFQPDVASLPVHAVMGYPYTADITSVYGRYVPLQPAQDSIERDIEKLISTKTKLVAWAARNCHNTFWPRLDFVRDLQRYIPVDVYGDCGNQNLTCYPWRSQSCLKLFANYKFFLSIENSECPDYITEKFWNAIDHGMLPVVYGPSRAMYESVAPPHSFIHIADFQSVRELANYMLYLSENPAKYAEYFLWRFTGSYRHGSRNPISFCEIPDLVQRVRRERRRKKALFMFPFYSSCRPQSGHEGFSPGVPYETWKPR